MLIRQFTIGNTQTNSYVLGSAHSHTCLVIDVADKPNDLLEFLSESNLQLKAVLITHGHYDHIAGLKKLLAVHTQAKLIMGRNAQSIARNPLKNYSAFFALPIAAPKADRLVAEPESIEFDGLTLGVLDLPGHSPGSIGLFDTRENSVYCGDTLFYGSVGRTDFSGASGELLAESIRNKLLTLPDDTKVFPGHGRPTTIGFERKNNPFLNGEH